MGLLKLHNHNCLVLKMFLLLKPLKTHPSKWNSTFFFFLTRGGLDKGENKTSDNLCSAIKEVFVNVKCVFCLF